MTATVVMGKVLGIAKVVVEWIEKKNQQRKTIKMARIKRQGISQIEGLVLIS